MISTADTHIYLNSAGIVCSLGAGLEQVSKNLFNQDVKQDFLSRSEFSCAAQKLPVGKVTHALPSVSVKGEQSRNNQLLTLALEPLNEKIEVLKGRFGAERIGIVVGTSTSGIAEGEAALRTYHEDTGFRDNYRHQTQEISAPSRFLASLLGTRGPAWTVSTACTSGGKALAAAARLLQLNVCDAVVCGGADSLCGMTIAGFSALELVSDSRCNPFSINRQGLNIGEGAGIFIVSREPGPVRLAGYGETSDAYHISSPHPEGRGAEQAMMAALQMASVGPEQIDYINLHGTATVQNDKMEALAVTNLLGNRIACSSTKPLTGHTLGAAGAIEAVFCWLVLQRQDGRLPPHCWDAEIDSDIPGMPGLGATSLPGKARIALSNSFAFGGNNFSLLLAAYG